MRILQTGLTHHVPEKATAGFTLYSPLYHPFALLLNMEGEEVHRWELQMNNGCHAQLLENGNLLICEESDQVCSIPHGRGGYIREYDWDSNLVWEHIDHTQHHDVRRLPNGNTLYLGWELMPTDEAANKIKGGLPDTEHEDGGVWCDYIREVTPSGEPVWEWHHWDEDLDQYPVPSHMDRSELAHTNCCFPMANGDILIGMQRHSFISIVGRESRRIEWEYRNPEFGRPHDAQFLDNGNMMVFANGLGLGAMHASRIMEFNHETKDVIWEYAEPRALEFYSPHLSGCQRLPSGNTLICEGAWGRLFEVSPEGELVWEYICPYEAHREVYGPTNWVYRALRYLADSPQIQNRV